MSYRLQQRLTEVVGAKAPAPATHHAEVTSEDAETASGRKYKIHGWKCSCGAAADLRTSDYHRAQGGAQNHETMSNRIEWDRAHGRNLG